MGRPEFASLEVGVRLDIGVADQTRFFVNEITRVPGADMFARQHLARPCLVVAEAWAARYRKLLSI